MKFLLSFYLRCEVFKNAFLDNLFPQEKREPKVEFINLSQSSMNVQQYSLKFTLLSKYVQSMVSNPRDEIGRYMTGVSNQVEEECRTTMLNDDRISLGLWCLLNKLRNLNLTKRIGR